MGFIQRKICDVVLSEGNIIYLQEKIYKYTENITKNSMEDIQYTVNTDLDLPE